MLKNGGWEPPIRKQQEEAKQWSKTKMKMEGVREKRLLYMNNQHSERIIEFILVTSWELNIGW